jgi:hypothetical protein
MGMQEVFNHVDGFLNFKIKSILSQNTPAHCSREFSRNSNGALRVLSKIGSGTVVWDVSCPQRYTI